jgi:hypothetical protein
VAVLDAGPAVLAGTGYWNDADRGLEPRLAPQRAARSNSIGQGLARGFR